MASVLDHSCSLFLVSIVRHLDCMMSANLNPMLGITRLDISSLKLESVWVDSCLACNLVLERFYVNLD